MFQFSQKVVLLICLQLKNEEKMIRIVSMNGEPWQGISGLPFMPELFNLRYSHAKDEDVFISHLFLHLNVGSVQGTDGQGTVQLRIDSDSGNKNVYSYHNTAYSQNIL